MRNSRRNPRVTQTLASGFAAALVSLLVGLSQAWAGETTDTRTVASRVIPVPEAVSPAMQAQSLRLPPESKTFPQTAEEWKALRAPAPGIAQRLDELRKRFGVRTSQEVIGGVRCFLAEPNTTQPSRSRDLLLAFHSGGFVSGSGEGALPDAILMAGTSGRKVITVDYRLLPDHPFPAAFDDAMSVWKEIVKKYTPNRVAIYGASTGGSLALSVVQGAKAEKLPLPGAVVALSPWADISKTGDSYYINAGLDNVVAYDDFWVAAYALYAGGRDLKDPKLSPVYGDFSGFPPTFLYAGTRDLFLSNTVRVQHKLLQENAVVHLEMGEAQSHGGFSYAISVDAPEGIALYARIAAFLDRHLSE